MELGEPDASGRRRPVEVPGSEFDIDVDTVIMSLGTSPNPLISSTTIRTGYKQEKMYHCADETTGQLPPRTAYSPAEMLSPELQRLFWQWAQERPLQRESMSS